MNKYLKALDHIYGYLETYDEQIDKDYETLKELIDNQSDYMSYQELKTEYEEGLKKYKEAFEKACELLESYGEARKDKWARDILDRKFETTKKKLWREDEMFLKKLGKEIEKRKND